MSRVLAELVVRDLGVIEHVSIVFGPGMTVLSGETGAGKTLLVEGIELLLGSRADPTLVRPGAAEARVDGRFVMGDSELVLSRVVPTTGRSRAYTDGAPVSAQTMGEIGRNLLDLHGQHAHQTLLSVATQREMLDEFASVDLAGLRSAQRTVATIDEHLRSLGGDDRARARGDRSPAVPGDRVGAGPDRWSG